MNLLGVRDEISNTRSGNTSTLSNYPKVSVIMPSLNVVPYIRECMESVVRQTFHDIEIICVDAYSTDGTLEVLREFAAKDERIKIILSDKKSYGYQMNLGLEAATGEYIGIVETDDWILKNMYETLYQSAKENDVDAVKAGYCKFYGKNEQRTFEKCAVLDMKYESLYNQVINAQETIDVWYADMLNQLGIYRRSFLQENSIRFHESAGAAYQDNGFWFQMLSQCPKIYFINEYFYMLCRDNPNSSCMNRGQVYAICDEYEFIRKFLSKDSEFEKRYASVSAFARFNAYMFTLNRIAQEYKCEFLLRFADDFRKIKNDGELDESLFAENTLTDLRLIMNDPEKYHKIYFSKNLFYRILRKFIWVQKKVFACCRYVKKYGVKFTWRYFWAKICRER